MKHCGLTDLVCIKIYKLFQKCNNHLGKLSSCWCKAFFRKEYKTESTLTLQIAWEGTVQRIFQAQKIIVVDPSKCDHEYAYGSNCLCVIYTNMLCKLLYFCGVGQKHFTRVCLWSTGFDPWNLWRRQDTCSMSFKLRILGERLNFLKLNWGVFQIKVGKTKYVIVKMTNMIQKLVEPQVCYKSLQNNRQNKKKIVNKMCSILVLWTECNIASTLGPDLNLQECNVTMWAD